MDAKEFIALMDSKHGESWSNSTEELAEAMEIYAKQYASQMPSEEEILKLIKQSLKHGFNSYESADAGLEAFDVDIEAKWILTKFLKSLQQENQTED